VEYMCPCWKVGLLTCTAGFTARLSRAAIEKGVHPEPGGRRRPLGGAALEDKVVQQAVVTILSQIYEEDAGGSKMMLFVI
jgi:hypothetical protein